MAPGRTCMSRALRATRTAGNETVTVVVTNGRNYGGSCLKMSINYMGKPENVAILTVDSKWIC